MRFGDHDRVQRQRHPSLLRPPIVFAHRGARAHAPENTVAAFELAVTLGATGLESDVWLTADGVCVLDHDGSIRRGWRRRPIAALDRGELPDHIPTLDDLLAVAGDLDVSVDLKDDTAGPAVIERAGAAGALDRLWLCHADVDHLVSLGDPAELRLVCSTRLRHMGDGPERFAARLADAGVRAVNLPQRDWTGGLTTLFHRFGVLAFGWDAQYERTARDLVWMGVDALYGDDVSLLHSVVTAEAV